MNDNRRQLIERLASELQPVRPSAPPVRVAIMWWLATWVFVAGITLVLGPMRPGALGQVTTHGQFLLESLLGLVAAVIVAMFAFDDSVPGNARRSVLIAGLILMVAWMLAYVIGLQYPALPPSMAGKRPDCFLEALLYAAPPAAVGIFLCGRYYVLAPVRTTALITLAAAMVPALFMQFACMYDPVHILTHHILPIPLLVAAAVTLHGLLLAVRGAWRRFARPGKRRD